MSLNRYTPNLLENEDYFRRWRDVSCRSWSAARRERLNNEYGVLRRRLAGVLAR